MTEAHIGLLVINKPIGLTSHDVVNKVRWLSGIRRVGHAGTLDPLASGVLLLAVGRATRLIEYLVGRSKRYQAVVRLGQETDTYDREGEVVAERPVQVTDSQLEAALERFRGPIEQVPPMFSAVKQGGQPLYRLARRGQAVERPARAITIYELSLLDWRPPEIELLIHCSSGTYIRSLAHDLGQVLGCGGHLATLRRLAVGDFTLDQAVPLPVLDRKTGWLTCCRLTGPSTTCRPLFCPKRTLYRCGMASRSTVAQIRPWLRWSGPIMKTAGSLAWSSMKEVTLTAAGSRVRSWRRMGIDF
jgi:tRNA pseudouridine55 synthase